jgi:cobalt-zinc-cadmium resistance protein CzcA
MENMVVGIMLIFVLQWAFLGNLRSAIIVAAPSPSRWLCRSDHRASGQIRQPAVGGRAGLRSGGRCHGHHGGEHLPPYGRAIRTCEGGHGHFSLATRLSSVLHASSEVSRGIFFAAAIIIASFLPLFTLTGVEGHIFGPMAKTYAYAIWAA